MHRTQGEDYVEIDGKRMYQAANPATATKATRLPADDMNAIQEEIAGAIESAGITLRATASADKAAGYTQLTAAIRALRDETGGTWKTFPLSAAALDVDGWTQNAIVLPSVWFDSIAYSSVTIKNAIMIVIPKWSAAGDTVTSCTFAQTEGATCPILRGNILLLQFGADGKISSYFSIPASSVDAIAQLKSLSVTNAVNAANVTATNAVNAENVTATSGVNANAVNATNVTATGNVNAAGNIATLGNALVARDFICAQEIHDDTTIIDEATPGTRRLLYNIGDQPLNIQVHYLAAETDTAGTVMQSTLPARSGMEFVYLRSHPNTAGTYTCHEWGVVV